MGKTRKRIVIEKSLAGSPAIHDLARHPQLAGRITVCERAEVQAMVAWGDVDLVVLDADTDLAGALDLVVRVRRAPAHARALLLRSAPTPDFSEEAILTGAAGIVGKGEPAPVLLKALSCIRRGELWVDRKTTGRVFERLVGGRVAKKNDAGTYADLTRREVAIIGHVVRHPGAPNRMLAASLNISQNTLRNHLHAIYTKLRIRRRAELGIFDHRKRPGDMRGATASPLRCAIVHDRWTIAAKPTSGVPLRPGEAVTTMSKAERFVRLRTQPAGVAQGPAGTSGLPTVAPGFAGLKHKRL